MLRTPDDKAYLSPQPPLRSGEGESGGGGRGRSTLLSAVALLAIVLLGGCGGRDTIAGTTPEATAQAFVDAMKAGEYDTVAAGFDYETYARANNEDWDSIPSGQQTQIFHKLQEEKAQELQALAGMFAGEASVGQVQAQGGSASAIINAGANSLTLRMMQADGEWRVSNVVEQAG
jgi:hypothetical protein